MIYKAKENQDHYIGLNRNRINNNIYTKSFTTDTFGSQVKIIYDEEGNVEDRSPVRKADNSADLPQHLSDVYIEQTKSNLPKSGRHPHTINRCYTINTLVSQGYYTPYLNFGYKIAVEENYYTGTQEQNIVRFA